MKKLLLKYNSMLIAIILCLAGEIAANAQTWSATASMTDGRYIHTATLLSNGKVLVAGGEYAGGGLASCELYNPVTNTWSSAAIMAGSRAQHTATLLSNGKVLVAGGLSGSTILTSCELYDPVTNTWSAAASMAASRYHHTATLLSNGKVLVTGGYDSGPLSSCELYDPITNTWSTAASVTDSRYAHTATLFSDGTVLVTGGLGVGGVLVSCELYNPLTNTWSAAASMAGNRFYHTATLFLNGKVYVTGGVTENIFLTSCELYDPASNTWSTSASMTGGRYDHTTTLLSNGKVLVAGGYGLGGSLTTCEQYDPLTNTWSTADSMAGSRYDYTATLLTNGKVLVVGGNNGSSTLSSCELYSSSSCTAPTFSLCPSNINANAVTGTCGANVSYTAIFTGTPDPTVAYSFSGATIGSGNGTGSSSSFNQGITNVSITASNGCGSDTTCNFTVTIMDTEKPTIVCTADDTINTTPGLCTGTTSLINPTVRDNCSTVGNALSFDGGYIDVPHNDLLNPINELTIETWVKRVSNGIQESLIEKYSNQGDTFGYLLRITAANKAFTMVLNASNQGVDVTGSTTILPNVWYHLAATFNRNTGVLKLYVNGFLDGQITGISGLPSTPGNQSLKIGARGDDAATRLTNGGIIDEARIWNIERTQAQLKAGMFGELNAQVGLVALYHYNQGTPEGNNSASPGPAIDTAVDSSGNGFAGTLNGFTLTGSTSNWLIGNVGQETLSVTNDAPEVYPIGNTTVTWTAIDESNNSSTCTQTVTVLDDQQPVITCPAALNINRDADEGGNTYTVVGTEFDATATDNCAETSLTYTLTGVTTGTGITLAGAVFESGVTTITWTATDGVTTPITCSFTVTVLENINPQIHWVKIAAGGDSSYGIKSDGTLWAWGYNQDGQVGTDTNWKSISTGSLHSVGLKSDGTLWAWGQNGDGQLGDGTTIDKSIPTLISAETNWQSISTGVYHTIAIKNDGTLWAWGYNAYGQLGNGANADITIPTQIGTDTNWKSIAGGAFYTVAIKTDGTLWAWGDNTYGQIGDGTNFRRNIPTQISAETNWKSISAGAYHTIAVKSNGTLWTWGQNVNGRLGDGTFIDRNSPAQIGTDVNWQIVGAGGNHSIAKKTDGTLWAWGFNGDGQLGDGTNTEKNTPILIGTETNWQSIAAGGNHTIGLKFGGMELCVTGSNNSGQLGDGTTINRNTFLCIPITEPYAITCPIDKTVNIDFGNNTAVIDNIDPVVTPNNAAYTYTLSGDTVATGSGTASGLTFNKGATTVTYTLTADVTKTCSFIVTVLVNENPQLHWKSIAVGSYHTVGIKSDGTFWAWGRNLEGQLGNGTYLNSNIPIQIGTDTNWQSVSVGYDHTIAVKSNGTLWAWGNNFYGQLGDGTTIYRNVPVQIGTSTNWVNVSLGNFASFGLKSDGTLWAWGYNVAGQLGDGTTIHKYSPEQIGADSNWQIITSGNYNTYGIKSDGTLWGWGLNTSGQLGDGTFVTRNIPLQIGIATNWKSITTGDGHTVGIKSDGTLWAWGLNGDGQLGDGTNTNRIVPEQIGTDSDWQVIAARSVLTMGIKSDNTLWAWGDNSGGQLGDGTFNNKNVPTKIGVETNWDKIVNGESHSIGLKLNGLGFCGTGSNNFGQLGDGTFIDKNSFICIPIIEPYTISCPTDKITNTDAGFCTAIVNAIDAVVTPADAVYSYSLSGVTSGSGNGSVSGLLFNAGSTNVTYTLTEDTTKTCSFIVTVTTNDNPQVSWKNISASGNHTLGIKSDGTLWSWGSNGLGILGDGTSTPQFRPIQIGTDSNWQSISAGTYNSYAIKTDGTLWGWGQNIGDGTNITKYIPTQIGNDTHWILVSASSGRTFAIKSDGTLWGWGDSVLGYQIGSSIPVQIGNGTNWTSISNGNGSHFLALKSDGTLWSWGRNPSGQLGDGTTTDRYSWAQVGSDNHWQKIAAGGSNSFATKTDGTLWGWGYLIGDGTYATRSSPTQIGIDTNWQNVSGGGNHVLALKSNGTLWASGVNNQGQFGNGTNTYYNTSFLQIGNDTDWRSITAGYENSFLIKKCGSLYCATGRNNYGQLGDGTSINRNSYECIPILVPCIPPQANVGLPVTICQGESITIGAPAVAGHTYEWQGGIYPGSSTEANPIISPYFTNTYTLIETDTATGCKNANSVTITVNPAPLAKTGLIKTLCSGNSTTLGAAAVSGNSYSWVSNPAGFTSTTANPLVSPTETSTYTLIETITATGCSKTNSVTVTVNPSPTVTATASASSICIGSNSTLTATGASSYSWSPAASLSSDTGATVIATPTATTTYTVTGIDTNADGWSQTEGLNEYFGIQTQTVTNNDKTYAIQYNYFDYQLKVYEFNRENGQWSIKFGTNFYAFYYSLLCTFSSEGKIYILDQGSQLWQFDPVSNNLISKANFPNSNPYSQAEYYSAFSVNNKGFVIIFNSTYDAELDIDTYENQVWEYNPILNTWTQKSNFVGNPRSAGVGFSIGNRGYFGTGVWYNQATDENLSLSDFWEYNQSSDTWIQKADIGNSGRVSAVGFSVGNKGYLGTGRSTYDYQSEAKKDFWEYDPNSNIWLQKTDFSGIARSQAIGFSDGNTAYVGLGLNYTLNNYGPLQDIWKYESGCVSSSTVTVTVNPLPVANAGSSSSICSGNNVIIGATAVIGNTYNWVSNPVGFTSIVANPTVSPTVTTTYTLTETVTATGCAKSNDVTIIVNPVPLANAGSSSSICSGSTATIGATAVTGNTYNWVSNPVGFTSIVANPTVSPTVTTTYTLTETVTATGCTKSNSAIITVNPLPVATLGTFSPVCANGVAFTLTGGLPLGGNYSGTGISAGSFSPTVAGGGTHTITYTYVDSNSCSNSVFSSITVYLAPVANAGPDLTAYYGYGSEQCVKLIGSASGGVPPYQYLWSNGATTVNTAACPKELTSYSLLVTDANGCTNTDEVTVSVIDVSCEKNKVKICHSGTNMCVKVNEVKTHLAHGDKLGTCTSTISFSKNTDISSMDNGEAFLIYPNPTTGSFTVEVCKNDVVEGAKLQVVNALGQIIFAKNAFKIDGCIKETIELNHALPEGVYSLKLIIGDNVETKKLIFKK